MPSETDQDTIQFIVASKAKGGVAELSAVSVKTLAKNIETACRGLGRALQNARKVGGFELDQVTIGLEVSAEGGVAFIGSVNVGGKGAVTLTFKPPKEG